MVRDKPEGLADLEDYYGDLSDYLESAPAVQVNDAPAKAATLPSMEKNMSIKEAFGSAWDKTKKFVKDNPALSGALAGGAAGSAIPFVGTVTGAVAGAVIGYNVGRDDDQKGTDKKETE
jgi:hypothetical protein